jgi:hypothetical protein
MRCMEWLLEEAAVVMDMPLNVFLLINITIKKIYPIWYSFFSHNTVYFTYNVISRGRCGHDCIVVGFTITCAISAYHH